MIFSNARCLRRARGADDASGRTREDRVLALKSLRVRESARGLHELQSYTGELRGDLIDVASQHRREVGIHDRRIAARDQLHERAHAMRHRDLRVADASCQFLELQLVRG